MNERIYCVKRPSSWSPLIVGKSYFMKTSESLGGILAYILVSENETVCFGMHQVEECFILIDRIAKKEIQEQFEQFTSFPIHQFIEDLEAINKCFDWYTIDHGNGTRILHIQDKSRYETVATINITLEKNAQKGSKRYAELLHNALDTLHQILH